MSDPLVRIPDHSLNVSKNHLKHFIEHVIELGFGTAVTTASKYLDGPGRVNGDGFTIPYDGVLLAYTCYDGTNTVVDTSPAGVVTFSANDRISMYAFNTASSVFNVMVYLNGAQLGSGALLNLLENTTLFGTVFLKIKIPYA